MLSWIWSVYHLSWKLLIKTCKICSMTSVPPGYNLEEKTGRSSSMNSALTPQILLRQNQRVVYRCYTQRQSVYCRQTGVLSAGNLLSPLSKIQRLSKSDSMFLCMSWQKLAEPAGGGQARLRCSSCVRHTAADSLALGYKNHLCTFHLVRQFVMLPIAAGLQSLILSRWNKNKYDTSSAWQMEVRHSEK